MDQILDGLHFRQQRPIQSRFGLFGSHNLEADLLREYAFERAPKVDEVLQTQVGDDELLVLREPFSSVYYLW
jgi:hypothetical protein